MKKTKTSVLIPTIFTKTEKLLQQLLNTSPYFNFSFVSKFNQFLVENGIELDAKAKLVLCRIITDKAALLCPNFFSRQDIGEITMCLLALNHYKELGITNTTIENYIDILFADQHMEITREVLNTWKTSSNVKNVKSVLESYLIEINHEQVQSLYRPLKSAKSAEQQLLNKAKQTMRSTCYFLNEDDANEVIDSAINFGDYINDIDGLKHFLIKHKIPVPNQEQQLEDLKNAIDDISLMYKGQHFMTLGNSLLKAQGLEAFYNDEMIGKIRNERLTPITESRLIDLLSSIGKKIIENYAGTVGLKKPRELDQSVEPATVKKACIEDEIRQETFCENLEEERQNNTRGPLSTNPLAFI